MKAIETQISRILAATERLTLYRTVFDDPIMEDFRSLLRLSLKSSHKLINAYYGLLEKLLSANQKDNLPDIDLFKNYLLEVIIRQENTFTMSAGRYEYEQLDPLVSLALKNDLFLLREVYNFEFSAMQSQVMALGGYEDLTPDYGALIRNRPTLLEYPEYYYRNKMGLKIRLAGNNDWGSMTRDLYDFYQRVGSGLFGPYWVFKWSYGEGRGYPEGIPEPDPIKIDDLVGYERQKAVVLRNTKQFIRGYSANNMLLYGDRGTGKSSTIKSLIHLFGAEGLRLVEISKHDLLSLHLLIDTLKGRPQKFIIFIDDLSFEEDDTEYKDLKALLEGSVARPPKNMLVYATSNRRNLVREFFSDREADEVGRQDTYQEKLSLADRFGIKLTYGSQNKTDFLKTVDKIAAREGLDIEDSELHELAQRWVLWHNAQSGRTAMQFINDLKGKLDLEK